MTYDGALKAYEVRDRDRTLRFNGCQLADATSEDNGKRRWVELDLYRTEAGTYVVSGKGISTMDGEQTRYWAHQCGTAQGVVEQLYMGDDDDTRYLTDVSRRLLVDAGRHDEEIKRAYELEHVA